MAQSNPHPPSRAQVVCDIPYSLDHWLAQYILHTIGGHRVLLPRRCIGGMFSHARLFTTLLTHLLSVHVIDGDSVRFPLCASYSSMTSHALCFSYSNKWVLEVTAAPLFFLFTQLLIAVILFLAANAAGIIKIPIHVDMTVVKGLGPMIALNVVGLRCAHLYS